MKELVFATHNPGKTEEMRQILGDLGISILSLEDLGIDHDTVEDQDTFKGNALKKAREAAELTGKWAVADDSGICIDALKGRPGVFSARWAQMEAPGTGVVEHTLNQLKGVPEAERQAQFVSVAALVAPDGREWVFRGEAKGEILLAPVDGGHKPKLPYDIIFRPEGHKQTFSQMTDELKNELSHRGIAFRKLAAFLTENRDQL